MDKKYFDLIFFVLLLSFLAIAFNLILTLLMPEKIFGIDDPSDGICVSEAQKKQTEFKLNQEIVIKRGIEKLKSSSSFDKPYQLDGKVVKFGTAIGGRPYLHLQLGNIKNFGCFYEPKFTSDLKRQFKPGEAVQVFGFYKGEVLNNYIFVRCKFSCR